MRYFIILVLTIVVGVCVTAQKSEIKNGVEYVTFTRDAFKTSVKLNAEQVKFNTPLNPMLFYFLNDTLVLTACEDEKYHLGEIYDIRTGALVTKCIPKGRGPGELLQVHTFKRSINKAYFEVSDINYHKYATFNIDSVLMFGLNYKPFLYELPVYIGEAVMNSKNELVCRNRWNMFHDDYDNKVFSFCKYMNLDSMNFDVKPPFGRPRFNYGKFFASPINDEYVYATTFYGDIQFWDKDLKKTKVLTGPSEYRPEFYLYKPTGHISIKNKRTYFSDLCNNPTSMYLSFYDKLTEEFYDFIKQDYMEVFQIGWNGEFMKRFELDKFVHALYVDSKGEYLYGTKYDFESYPKLYRFKL